MSERRIADDDDVRVLIAELDLLAVKFDRFHKTDHARRVREIAADLWRLLPRSIEMIRIIVCGHCGLYKTGPQAECKCRP